MIGLTFGGCYSSKLETLCLSHKVGMVSQLNNEDENAVKSLNQNEKYYII